MVERLPTSRALTASGRPGPSPPGQLAPRIRSQRTSRLGDTLQESRTTYSRSVRDRDKLGGMLHTQIRSNDARLARQPGAGEAVVITRYGKPEFVVLRWDDFAPLESVIDRYLQNSPYDLAASDLAVRASEIDEQPEGSEFDYAGLAHALGD